MSPMKRRLPSAQCWLMTDARLGDRLPAILAAMPPRSAVIVRPYAMNRHGRTALIRRMRHVARAKRHLFLHAGRSRIGFDGLHLGGAASRIACPGRYGLMSIPVHNAGESARALRIRADVVLVSPLWPTRSHSGAITLGARGFARLAARHDHVIALGGMTAARFRTLRHHGAHGWAAIDAWQDSGRSRQCIDGHSADELGD